MRNVESETSQFIVLCLAIVWAQELEWSKKQKSLQSRNLIARVHVRHILPVYNPEPIYMSSLQRLPTFDETGTSKLIV